MPDPYPTAVIADTPFRYYRMGGASGTIPDSSGNAGTAVTVAATRNVAGALTGTQDDGACSFNGTTNNGSVAVDLSALSVITLEFWLKWTTNAADDDFAMEFTANANGVNGSLNVDWNNSTGGVEANTVSVKMGSAAADARWSFPRPSAGVFHHIVLVLDRAASSGAGALTAYVDGVAVTVTNRQAGSTLGNFANSTLYLMSRAGTALNGAGVMDELAIYSGALSSTQVSAHYAAASSVVASLNERWGMAA